MKNIFLFAAISITAGLLFANIYNSWIDAPNWGSHLPASMQVTRDYYSVANPGNFYRVVSPVNQVLILICLLLFWKRSKFIRFNLAIALLFALGADVLTFAYFYPRNHIMFSALLPENLDKVKTAWEEWSLMNWVRSALAALALILLFLAQNKAIQPIDFSKK